MTRILRCSITIVLAVALSGATALAQRRGGGGNRGNVRSSSRNSVHRNNNRNTNINRNMNVNRNTNINRNINVHRDVNVYGGGGCCYHSGWGTAAAIATTAVVTAAVVGSMVNTLPPSCSVMVVNGFTYQQCGGVWYQPQMSGSSTTFIVVNAPR